MMTSLIIGSILILTLVIWGILEYDRRDLRRLNRFIALHSKDERIVDEVELYVADRVSRIFLVNKIDVNDLKPTMKISNLYKIDNMKAVFDDMEYEQLVLDVEDKYGIKISENDITDFGTIRDFANFIKSRLTNR